MHNFLKLCLNDGMDDFTAKNENQFFLARTLSLTFIQMVMLQRFVEYLEGPQLNDSEKKVINMLAAIYGLWNLEKHLGHLFQFEILINKAQISKIHQTLLGLCKTLTSEAVALVDVLAPPDFILNSVLGNSDGDIYKHLRQSFYENPFGKPSYWKEIISNMSKL